MLLCKHFSADVKKRCFLILHGSVLTRARWSETFWYHEVRNSLLVNLVQKLSKSFNICKNYCKKFSGTFLWTQCMFSNNRKAYYTPSTAVYIIFALSCRARYCYTHFCPSVCLSHCGVVSKPNLVAHRQNFLTIWCGRGTIPVFFESHCRYIFIYLLRAVPRQFFFIRNWSCSAHPMVPTPYNLLVSRFSLYRRRTNDEISVLYMPEESEEWRRRRPACWSPTWVSSSLTGMLHRPQSDPSQHATQFTHR